jgi:hypothetical protein
MIVFTDVVLMIIRIIAIIAAIILIIEMFISLRVILKTGELDKAAFELQDGILSSNLTVSRGIFNSTALDSLHESKIEPVRLCGLGAQYEFYIRTPNGWSKNWSFGYKPRMETIVASPEKLEIPVGIALDGRLDQVKQGKLEIQVWDTWVTRASCAAERAWFYNINYSDTINCIPSMFGCYFYLQKIADELCFQDDCRWLPGVNVTYRAYQYFGKSTFKMWYNSSINAVEFRIG